MTDPVLEVLATVPPFTKGHRIAVTNPSVVGRQTGATLRLPAPGPPEVALVEFQFGRWWLRALAGHELIFLNGEVVNNDAELHDGDVVELEPGHVFRFLSHSPPAAPTDAALEAELVASDDPARWLVYADWLLEHGNPLGEDVARGETAPERRGRTLGALARAHREGVVEIAWRFGVPWAVVVRNPDEVPAALTPAHVVQRLLDTPVFRFTRSLDVDARSFGSGAQVDEFVTGVLSTLAGAPSGQAWPSLRELRFGPMARHALTTQQMALFEQVRAKAPGLATTGERCFAMFDLEHPTLELVSLPRSVTASVAVGQRVSLHARRPNLVGASSDCVLELRANSPVRLVARFEAELDRWWFTDVVRASRFERHLHGPLPDPVRVNGIDRERAQLRDGDLLQLLPVEPLAPGVTGPSAPLVVRFGLQSVG